jgi:phosphoserine phosphatase
MLDDKYQLEKLCSRYHKDSRIQYKARKIYSKFFNRLRSIVDIDKTLTREGIYEIGLKNLRKHNRELQDENNFRTLCRTVEDIDGIVDRPEMTKEEIGEEINRRYGKFVFYLKKFGVNYSQMVDTGLDVATETPLRANTNEFLSELQNRGIKSALLSGSFIDWVYPWWCYKLSIPGIDLIATELEYASDGSLTGRCKARIGPGKLDPAFAYIKKENCTPDLTIAFNDDFIIDGKSFLFTFGFGTVFLVGKIKREFEAQNIKYEGDLEIVEEADENLMVLIPRVDKRIRERAVPEIFTAEELYELAVEGKKMRMLEEKSKEEKGKELNSIILEILKSCERVFSLQPPEILTEFMEARNLYIDLKISLYREDEKNLRKQASELCTVLFSENPELKLTDDYIEELSRLKV